MNKPKQKGQTDSARRGVGSRGNGTTTPLISRRGPRRDPHLDFSEFGRDGGDNDLSFMADLYRRSSDD